MSAIAPADDRTAELSGLPSPRFLASDFSELDARLPRDIVALFIMQHLAAIDFRRNCTERERGEARQALLGRMSRSFPALPKPYLSAIDTRTHTELKNELAELLRRRLRNFHVYQEVSLVGVKSPNHTGSMDIVLDANIGAGANPQAELCANDRPDLRIWIDVGRSADPQQYFKAKRAHYANAVQSNGAHAVFCPLVGSHDGLSEPEGLNALAAVLAGLIHCPRTIEYLEWVFAFKRDVRTLFLIAGLRAASLRFGGKSGRGHRQDNLYIDNIILPDVENPL